jgi:hypothetical protein
MSEMWLIGNCFANCTRFAKGFLFDIIIVQQAESSKQWVVSNESGKPHNNFTGIKA